MTKKKEIQLDPVVIQNKARMDEIVEELKAIEVSEAERKAILLERIQKLTEQSEDKGVCAGARKRHLQEELKVLMDTVPKSETKTQFKVSLLCGDVILKKADKDYDKDPKKLLQWALENNLAEFVRTKQEFDWAKFKATLEIVDDGVIINKETGEVMNMDGLGTKDVPEELVIK
ncbi:MAG: host-nuclease inhibitor Gam family protein [Clostridiales bacterium]|nr:host-nuclease inhibitor Gam family protein [Clostridiales bacterium]